MEKDAAYWERKYHGLGRFAVVACFISMIAVSYLAEQIGRENCAKEHNKLKEIKENSTTLETSNQNKPASSFSAYKFE